MVDKTRLKRCLERPIPLNHVISRRRFLKTVGQAAEVAALAGTGLEVAAFLLASCGTAPPETAIPTTKAKITLGDEIEVSLQKFGIQWTPDVHVSYITFPKENIRRFFLTGNGGFTYLLEGNASDDLLTLVKKTSKAKLLEVWGPDKFPVGRYGYSAISSVLQIDSASPGHLIGFTHNEQHAGANPSGTFTASISHLESVEGGITWQPVGTEPIIKGDDPMPPGTCVSGAGQPCAIIKDDYIYVYYIDWARKHVHHPDQIYLARANIEANGTVGTYEFYKGNQRFAPEETDLTPVIATPNKESGSYVALPSISYNTSIHQLLGILELNGAFGVTTSVDGIHWNIPEPFMTFTPHSQIKVGDIFISYPTLISQKEASDGITDATSYLIYAKGSPHNMVMRSFTIS